MFPSNSHQSHWLKKVPEFSWFMRTKFIDFRVLSNSTYIILIKTWAYFRSQFFEFISSKFPPIPSTTTKITGFKFFRPFSDANKNVINPLKTYMNMHGNYATALLCKSVQWILYGENFGLQCLQVSLRPLQQFSRHCKLVQKKTEPTPPYSRNSPWEPW